MESEIKLEKPLNYGLPQDLVDRVFRNLERDFGVDDGREEDWSVVARAIVDGEKINMSGRGKAYEYEFDVFGVNKGNGEIKVIDNSTRKVYFLRASAEAVRLRRAEAVARAAWSAAQDAEDARLSAESEKALLAFVTARGLIGRKISADQVRSFPAAALAALPGAERMDDDSFLKIDRSLDPAEKILRITYYSGVGNDTHVRDMWEFKL